jgi:WD40-like Beta Propeller Repeat
VTAVLATETTQVEATWRVDLRSTPSKPATISDTECLAGVPSCSPDGRLQAFLKKNAGILEIWLSNADGTNGHLLAKAGPITDTGAPNLDGGWSPDGKWIAFRVFPGRGNTDFQSYLYVVPSTGGAVRRLAREAYSFDDPTWSRDSKSLYGVRGWPLDDRSHARQSPLVRVDIAEDKLVLLGADGIRPQVSPDSRFLYFFTSPYPKLSRIPIGGGPEERLSDRRYFAGSCPGVGSRYLYLFQEPPQDGSTRLYKIVRFDPVSRQATELADVPFQPRFAYLSPDEHFLYFGQLEDRRRRVVLVRGLL